MPKKPEENVTPEAPKKPTHSPKPEKGLGVIKKPGAVKPGEQKPGAVKPGEQKPGAVKPGEQKPGAVKPGEQKPEADKHTPVITHRHEKKARVERDCTQCKYAVQVSDTEWECIKEHYFPNTLICFAPKDEEVAET